MFNPSSPQVWQFQNQVTLIQHPLPVPVVVADVWIEAGASWELEPQVGLAHFLEHMVFKGTDQVAPGQFDRLIENRGGVSNAATSHDYVHFFLATIASEFSTCFPLLAQLIVQPSLPEDCLEQERQVVLAELGQQEDDPESQGWLEFYRHLYPNHPYGRSLLGERPQLLTHGQPELQHFHRNHYQPQKTTVVLSGGLDPNQGRSLVETALADFFSPGTPAPSIPPVTPLVPQAHHSILTLPHLTQSRLLMGWTIPQGLSFQDACALELLTVILTGGRSSRLVQLLREQRQVVEDVEASFSWGKWGSCFTIAAWPTETAYTQTTIDLILVELQSLQRELLPLDPMQRAKKLLLHDFLFAMETPLQRTSFYGYHQVLGTPCLGLSYGQNLRSLTATRLVDVAQTYLGLHNVVMTIVHPQDP